jgi:hypothetical protein
LKSSFGLICRETYLCSECDKIIRQHEAYCREFAVQFPAKSSRQSNLRGWFSSQSIDERMMWNLDPEFEETDDQYRCQCNVGRPVQKTTTFHRANNYILIQIKAYEVAFCFVD